MGYLHNGECLPQINVSASKNEADAVHVTLCNLDPKAVAEVELTLSGVDAVGQVSGQILTAAEMTRHNTFDQPERLKPAMFQSFSTAGQTVSVELAPMSVSVLEIGV